MKCKCGFENATDARCCGSCRAALVDEFGNLSAAGIGSSTSQPTRRRVTPPRSQAVPAVSLAAILTMGCWWFLPAGGNLASRADEAADRIYWIDGALVVEPVTTHRNYGNRLTVYSARGAEPLAEACYAEHFQLADGSVVYSLTDCGFEYEAVYHWRPGQIPLELHRVTRDAKTGMLPHLETHQLGPTNRVLISGDSKDPLLFDAITGAIGRSTLATTESLKALRPDFVLSADAWTWFKDGGFESDIQGTELIYTRCSGDDYRPTCGLFRQSIVPWGPPELLHAERSGSISAVQRRGQYLFCSFAAGITVLDLSSLVQRQVFSEVDAHAFSPDGTKLAIADQDSNIWVLIYDEGAGTYNQPRRLTNFPTGELHGYKNVEWISNSVFATWIESGASTGGIWRADVDSGALDRLWEGEDTTQDAFFNYVRKQKGETRYSVRIPRTTLIPESTARVLAKIPVFTLGPAALAAAVLVDTFAARTE